MIEAADHWGLFRDHKLVDLRVAEREERERAAIGHAEEGVAHRDIAAEPAVVVLLAPGGDERDAQQVLEELTVHFLVAHDIGVVVQTLRQFGEQRRVFLDGFRDCHS